MGACASHPAGILPTHFPEIAVLPPASQDSITSLILRGQFFSVELAGVELQRRINRRQGPSTLSAKKPNQPNNQPDTLISKSRQFIPKVP